jgi:hypothetical protein
MSGFREGVEDVARSAWENIGSSYHAVLTGSPMPASHLTGDMVTVHPGEEMVQSYDAALRQHQAMEEADHRAAAEAMQYDRQAAQDIGAAERTLGNNEPDLG